MFATDRYIELLKRFPPRPVHSDEELARMQEVVHNLLDQPQLTEEEREYLNVLGALIYEYEETQEPIPDIYGVELLKFLLKERNLDKQELLTIFTNESTIDDILAEKQELSAIYIQELAKFFNVPVALFFPS